MANEHFTDGEMASQAENYGFRGADITPESLRYWLTQMKPEHVCGHSGESADCPLSRFFGPGALVSNDTVTFCASMIGKSLPVWAALFVTNVDDCADDEIEAQLALQLLDKSLAEAAAEGYPADG